MEENRIKLIDAILKFMLSNEYKFNTNFDGANITKQGFDSNLLWREWGLLVNENLLINRFEKSDVVFILTTDGVAAARTGISKYLKAQEKKNKKSKAPIIISIIAVCLSAIDPALKLKETIFPKSETEKRNNESYNRNYQTDSIVDQLLSDSVFIEKTKNILKHDTVFLNELKEKIKHEKKITTP